MLKRCIVAMVGLGTFLSGDRLTPAQWSPEEQLERLRAAQGLSISLFAAEPLVANPSAIDVDAKGRVWAAEIRHYRESAQDPPTDRIVVLEDTDGDGRADRSTVFAEGLLCPMSVCVAWPRVYVATSPDLWVYEDRDDDLRADGPPTKLLTGFNGINHDHGAHSLVLGPDHKWWMSHGDTGFDVAGSDRSRAAFRWGAVLRGELDGSRLEVVAHNFRNPYEPCVTSFGESFLSDNDNDGNRSARICWLLAGGNYGWYGGPPVRPPRTLPFAEGWHFRAHRPGIVPATLVTGFGSPAGICFYEGDLLRDLKGSAVHCDPGPREVRAYRHEPAGFGRKATSRILVYSDGDDYFRPSDVCVAPNGSLVLADWYDGGVGGHAYNDPERGRIFVVRPADASATSKTLLPPGPIATVPFATVPDALTQLANPNLATQFLARERLLSEPAAAQPALDALAANDDAAPELRARALWMLDRLGDAARGRLMAALRDPDSRFRALALRILREHGPRYASEIVACIDDESPDVCREALLSLPRLTGSDDARRAWLAAAHRYRGSDRFELETLNIAAEGRRKDLFSGLLATEIPRSGSGELTQPIDDLLCLLDPELMVGRFIAEIRQAASDQTAWKLGLQKLGRLSVAVAPRAAASLANDMALPSELRRATAELCVRQSHGEWADTLEESEIAAQAKRWLRDTVLRGTVLRAFDGPQLAELADDLLAIAVDKDTPRDERTAAIRGIATAGDSAALSRLSAMLDQLDPDLRVEAVKAIASGAALDTVRGLLRSGLSADERALALGELSQTSSGSLVLWRLLEGTELSPSERTEAQARLSRHDDPNVRAQISPQQGINDPKLGEAIQVAELLAVHGDAERGRAVFASDTARCHTCHRIHGAGGTVGPDLSQIGKKYERAALLETILRPSKAIAPEYVTHLVETDRGQFFVGFVEKRTDHQLVIRESSGRTISFDPKSITSLEPQPRSVMPELLLSEVTETMAADLLAYLTSLSDEVQSLWRLRAAGPFADEGWEHTYEPLRDGQRTRPDFSATFEGLAGRTLRWDDWIAREIEGRLVFERPVFGRPALEQPMEAVAPGNPAYVYATWLVSGAAQEVTLAEHGGNDLRLWINGKPCKPNEGASLGGAWSLALNEGDNALVILHRTTPRDLNLDFRLRSRFHVENRAE